MFATIIKLVMLAMITNLAFKPIFASLSIYSGYILILCSYALPFCAFKVPLNPRCRVGGICVILLTLVVLAGVLLNRSVIGFDLIKNILSFLCTYYAIALEPQRFTKRDLKHFVFICKMLSVLLIMYAYLPFSFRYPVVNEWGGTQFTMGLGNQNATSITIMFCISILLVGCICFPSVKNRLVSYVMIIALTGALVKLQCRTVVACCILMFFLYLFKSIRPRRYMAFIAMIVPIAFLFVQMWLGTLDSDMEIMGKSIATGRQDLFADALQLMQENPLDYLLGSLGKHQLMNIHNAPITIIANFGVIGFLVYWLFWSVELNGLIDQRMKPSMQRFAIFALLIFILHSAAEAGVMIGSSMYGTQLVIIARLAKDDFAVIHS